MDDRTKLREKHSAILRDIAILENKRCAIETALQILDEDDPMPSSQSAKKGYLLDPATNVGSAVAILHAIASQGLTLRQLIEKSAEGGRKAFVGTSISSQLRFQIRRGFVKKTGDIYYAVIS